MFQRLEGILHCQHFQTLEELSQKGRFKAVEAKEKDGRTKSESMNGIQQVEKSKCMIKNGNHLGEFDYITGEQTKPRNKKRGVEK